VREQRKIERIQPYVAPCRLVVGERALSAYVTDLSEAGARVTSETPPPAAGTKVVLEIRIGRRPARSRLQGEVEWVRTEDGSNLFGLSFAHLPTDQQQALNQVVADFRRRAAEIA
jgi:hypothetical protein